MPQRRSLSRYAGRSRADLGGDVRRARNEHLMEGIVAGCALVAYADGWVTDEERERMIGLIRRFEPIEAFGYWDVEAAFEAATARFVADQQGGETAALAAVARLKGVDRYPTLLVETCCAIADADGGFDEEERNAAVRICKSLGLDAAAFGLAEAP